MRTPPARGTWRGWLGILTHRRAVDWVRRSAVRRRRTAEAAPPAAVADPEEAAVAGSVAKSVQAAVDDLPAPQREAIRMWTGLRQLAARLEAEGIEP